MMKAEGLSGGYGDSRLINNVSLTVEKGEFLVFSALMGAEKPRFLRLLTGYAAGQGRQRLSGWQTAGGL